MTSFRLVVLMGNKQGERIARRERGKGSSHHATLLSAPLVVIVNGYCVLDSMCAMISRSCQDTVVRPFSLSMYSSSNGPDSRTDCIIGVMHNPGRVWKIQPVRDDRLWPASMYGEQDRRADKHFQAKEEPYTRWID